MQHDQRAFRSFWSKPDAPLSLGCVGCPFKPECGGQTIAGNGFNCLDHCCGRPESCQVVCPRAHVFTDRWREVRGFPLETPWARTIPAPSFISYLPLIFHGSSRNGRLAAPAIAISLYRFFDRNADCRFKTPAAVCNEFRLHSGAKLFLTGVAQDKEVERWWKLERAGRISEDVLGSEEDPRTLGFRCFSGVGTTREPSVTAAGRERLASNLASFLNRLLR